MAMTFEIGPNLHSNVDKSIAILLEVNIENAQHLAYCLLCKPSKDEACKINILDVYCTGKRKMDNSNFIPEL